MWVKIDDGFYDNGKVIAVGRDARALYLAALCYANKNATRGFVPDYMIAQLAAKAEADKPQQAAERLCTVYAPNRSSLWTRIDGGFTIHDYHEYQLMPEEVEHISEVRSEAGSKGGKKSAATRAAAKQAEEEAKQAEEEAKANQSEIEANPSKIQAKEEANASENPSKPQANFQQNGNPVSRIPIPESRLPNPAAAAPPTSPPLTESPPGESPPSAAAAVPLRFSGQNGSGMSAVHSLLPDIPLPGKPPDKLRLVLSPSQADAHQTLRALQDAGVSRADAEMLVTEAITPGCGFTLTDIQDQIEWLPYQNCRSPGYWLPKYVRDGRAKPKALVAAEQLARRQENQSVAVPGPSLASRKAEETARKSEEAAREEARIAYRSSLTVPDAAALEAAAEAAVLEHAAVRDYVRDHGKGSRSWQLYVATERNKIIDKKLLE